MIFLSDHLASLLFPTFANYQDVQTIKGGIYVFTTAILLYFLLREYWDNERKNKLDLLQEKEKLEEVLKELRASLNETKLLAGKLAEVEERERSHLAGELHDKVGQNLTALNIHLSILRMKIPSEIYSELSERIDDMQHLVEETMLLVRDVMTDLHPQVLDEYGLVAALRWLADQFQNRTGIHCAIECQSLPKRLPEYVGIAFFRIAQAAIDNITRHAEASAVNITLEMKDEIELVIADNGKGFDLDDLKRNLFQPSWGLGIMRERALAIGAALDVFSSPGTGTRVRVRIPKKVLDDNPSFVSR